MSSFTLGDALPRLAPRLRIDGAARQPLRRALVIAALALSISVFANAGAAEIGIAAPAHPATAPVASAPCATPDDEARPMTQAELAQPRTIGVEPDAGNVRSGCGARWFIPTPEVPAPAGEGRVILIGLTQQWLWAYQDGQLVYATPVTTGRPGLQTPAGTFRVTRKLASTTFYSPWPQGSPNYYAPLHINYALLFRDGGFYIHDAPWRQMFGPGTQNPHELVDGSEETGSHGCVNVTTDAGAWLYGWAGAGAQVVIA